MRVWYYTLNTALVILLSPAPSDSPASVTAGTVTANSITVQWEEVPCLHRNGVITGYTVVARTSGEDERVVNSGSRAANISGLISDTLYTVSVAAVNSAGTGPATSIGVETLGECEIQLILCQILLHFSLVGLTATGDSSSTDSLTVSWDLEDSLTAAALTISYFNTNTDCFTDFSTIPNIDGGSETMYTLTGLEEGTEYSITVTAILTGGGGTEQDTITATTMTAGESTSQSSLSLLFSTSYTHSSICPTLFCESVSE